MKCSNYVDVFASIISAIGQAEWQNLIRLNKEKVKKKQEKIYNIY